jgi:hypothetical protein
MQKKAENVPGGVREHSPVGTQEIITGFRLFKAGTILQSARGLICFKSSITKGGYKTAASGSWLNCRDYPSERRAS